MRPCRRISTNTQIDARRLLIRQIARPLLRGAIAAIASGALLAGAASAQDCASPDMPVAKLGDETLTLADIQPDVGFQVYRQQIDIYTLLDGAVKELVDRRLLQREAERRSMSLEQLSESLADGVAPATEADVDTYLERNPQAAAEPNARERIAYYLTERARIQARLDLLETLRKSAGFRSLLSVPEQPRIRVPVDGAPARGPEDAPVTLVHFASLTSDRSAKSAEQLRRLEAEFPGKIRWVHRSLPRDHDDIALAAAQLGAVAADAGKFWEVHDRLLARNGLVKPADLESAATASGLSPVRPGDLTQIDSVRRDIAEAQRIGVESEPVVFVNGRYHSSTFPYEQLRGVVAEELGLEPARLPVGE